LPGDEEIMDDRHHDVLLKALQTALNHGAEMRLYGSGKLQGLFPSRSSASASAATAAVRDGLLEITRTDIKGKASIEWVRITPKGVEFLHGNTTPLGVLRDLRRELTAARDGAPVFLNALQQEWQETTRRLHDQVQQAVYRLDALADRVEEALRRADILGQPLPNGVAKSVAWGQIVLDYLDQRYEAGAPENCPLSELYSAVRRQVDGLTLLDFQDGIRRLHDHRVVQLRPFPESADCLPEPEHAIVDGATVLYFAAKAPSH
jgi:DNA-binding PadR family transcriptional regulator